MWLFEIPKLCAVQWIKVHLVLVQKIVFSILFYVILVKVMQQRQCGVYQG